MSRDIKWGILGCGKIAHKFAQDMDKVDNTELYAVASRTEEKAKAFAEKYRTTEYYDSYVALAQDPKVDAIYVATPHVFHKENSILCLRHKKAVLCEKPFAMNLREVDEMIAVAKENEVLLMEALWTYFLPHYQYLLQVVQSKKYGELQELRADFGYKPETSSTNNRLFDKTLGGGSLLDIGIYPIFAALSTLGIPHSIESSAQFYKTGVDSECHMTFTYPKAKAILQSTFLKNTPSEAIFTFEKATMVLNTRFHEPTSITLIENGNKEIIKFNCQSIGYNYEVEHFNQLLKQKKTESDVMSFSFSKNLMVLLDKVRNQINLVY